MQATFSSLREWSGNKEIMSRASQVIGVTWATGGERATSATTSITTLLFYNF